MTRKLSLGCFLLLLFSSFEVLADSKLVKIGDSLIGPQALTIDGKFGKAINGNSFQQDAVVSHKGYQYVAYYDSKRHVCLARRKLPAGKWDILRFTDYDFKSNDAHNTISMGICPKDGTIHLAFDHHGHPLHYRVSKKQAASTPENTSWNEELFGPVISELEKGKSFGLTYPRFLQTPDGDLQFFYRRGGSGNGDRMLVDYDPQTGTWLNTHQIDSGKGNYQGSDSRCSYPNGYTYGPKGNLHATWVWREGPGTANHDLVYSYSRDNGKTWLNNKSVKLQEPAGIDSPDITVVKIPVTYGLMNTHGQAVDSQGRIHVVMWHCSDKSFQAAASKPGETLWGSAEARRYNHYWRDKNATWHHVELPWVAGNRPKLFFDSKDNAYLIYCTKTNFETAAMEAADLTIAGATAASEWTDWKIIHVEKGPFGNEMLGDPYRWKDEHILSVMVQGLPKNPHDPTPLRIIDFKVTEK